ncbi:MAG TPA: DUF2834 domain-containing protein [Nevskiaceae bacterium]|nr:DUF2834 domain-containing protein [Nevskiaceae bacterium]
MSASEFFYVLLGLAVTAATVWPSRHLYRAGTGAASLIEWTCYVTALAALVVGWYFNFQYMRAYGAQAGWWHWTTLLFVNPASASGGQDLIFGNVILFPIWTVIDARRTGMGTRAGWMYFVMSIFTSFAFAFALFLAVRERQLRCNARS